MKLFFSIYCFSMVIFTQIFFAGERPTYYSPNDSNVVFIVTSDNEKIKCRKNVLMDAFDINEDDEEDFFLKNSLSGARELLINSIDFKDLYQLMEIDYINWENENAIKKRKEHLDLLLKSFTTKRLVELIIAADKIYNDMDIIDILKHKLLLKLFSFKQNYVSYHNFMRISLLLHKLPVFVRNTILPDGIENFKIFLGNTQGIVGNPQFPDSINKYSFEQKILYALLFFNAQEGRKYTFGSDPRLDKLIGALELSANYYDQFINIPFKKINSLVKSHRGFTSARQAPASAKTVKSVRTFDELD